jgi:3-deoxy-D-manno-octulosonate 8-phosphate phosphatase (KDO 8-P phosphatase)
VLTDGRLYYGENGEMLKVFNVQDGHGMKAIVNAGIATAILSGRDHPAVTRRARDLSIAHVLQGIGDKPAALDRLLRDTGLQPENCGFIGDDWVDIEVMRRVGFAATVPNAADGLARHAHWISRRSGGDGAAREVCDLLLEARGLEPI